MVELVGQVGHWIGPLGNRHHSIHQFEMAGEGADVGVVALLLRSLEPDHGLLLGLHHPGTVQDAGVALGLPVLLHPLLPELQDRIDDFLALVAALGLARRADDEVVREVVGVLEGQLDLGVRFNAEGADVIFHGGLESRDDDFLVDLFESLGRVLGLKREGGAEEHRVGEEP